MREVILLEPAYLGHASKILLTKLKNVRDVLYVGNMRITCLLERQMISLTRRGIPFPSIRMSILMEKTGIKNITNIVISIIYN